jgi:hypothetical protein
MPLRNQLFPFFQCRGCPALDLQRHCIVPGMAETWLVTKANERVTNLR